ncbi:MAG: DUF459 domain-containing protein [Acidimicrobiia bacterium]
MRRLGWGLVAVALVIVGLQVLRPEVSSASARTTQRVPTRVSLFGDSLVYQARSAFVARMTERAPGDLVVSAHPGTAICDARPAILEDLLRRRPEVLVLEFSGNSFTDCMRDTAGVPLPVGSTRWRDRYLDGLRDILAVANVTDTAVLWATAPPVRHFTDPENYPRLLAAAARKLAATHRRLRVVDTGAALTSGGKSLESTLPCRPDERAFCVDGRIPVRAADGLHFDCHGTVDWIGGCFGYSAGGRRFGEAIADAAITGLRPVSS